MASTSSCSIDIKLENKCHKTTYSQKTGLVNFDVFSEREKLLLKLTQRNIKYVLSPQTNSSHQICNVAKKMCRSIQTTKETT